MLEFPEFLHLTGRFLNQSDCRTFQISVLKKQAILNMYLDIIEGLDIPGTNQLIDYVFLLGYGQLRNVPNFVLTNQIPRSLKLR